MLPAFSLVIVNNTAYHSSVFAGNSTNENIEVFRRLLDSKIDNRILSGFFLQQARRRSSVKLAYRAFLPLPGFFLQWKKTSPRYHRFPLYVRFAKKKRIIIKQQTSDPFVFVIAPKQNQESMLRWSLVRDWFQLRGGLRKKISHVMRDLAVLLNVEVKYLSHVKSSLRVADNGCIKCML